MTNYWLNTTPINELLSNRLGRQASASWRLQFMLSPDLPEELSGRFGGARDRYRAPLSGGAVKSPAGHKATPSTLSVSPDGNLLIGWDAANGEVLYPVLDTYALSPASVPPRSFAVWFNEFSAYAESHYFFQKFEVTTSDLTRIVYLIGSVGEKGSGADLEFEGLSEWKHGRPLYLPGNKLELPLSLIRRQTPAIGGTPALGFAGRSYLFQPQAGYVGRDVQWTVVAGTLPAGLVLDPVSGAISGTPTMDGTSRITLSAKGSEGAAKRALILGIGEAQLWRLAITASNGDSGTTSIQEVEWREVAGGPDVTSPATTVTGSSMHTSSTGAGATVDNSLVGNEYGLWISKGGAVLPHTLTYQLAPVTLRELVIWPPSGASWLRTPRDFTVQASRDGTQWTEVAAFRNVTDWVAGTPKTFSLV